MTASTDDVELRSGREAPQWTDVHDWVALSGVSPHAIALYVILRMHVNRERGDNKVTTTRLTLAVMMGVSRGDKIKPYLDELVAIDAIKADRVGLHGRHVYTVYQLPPDNWTGPATIKSWYARHRDLLALKRADEKTKRDARRAKAKQAKAVTPETGEQGPADSVTPKTGEPVTPETGEPVTPISGREPDVLEPDVLEPPSPPLPSSAGTPPVASDEEQKQEDPLLGEQPQVPAYDEDLAAEVIAARRRWSPAEVRQVLADPVIRERDPELVRAAFRLAAADRKTWSPRRLLHGNCPWWGAAARQLGLEPGADDKPPTSTGDDSYEPRQPDVSDIVNDPRLATPSAGRAAELAAARARMKAGSAKHRVDDRHPGGLDRLRAATTPPKTHEEATNA